MKGQFRANYLLFPIVLLCFSLAFGQKEQSFVAPIKYAQTLDGAESESTHLVNKRNKVTQLQDSQIDSINSFPLTSNYLLRSSTSPCSDSSFKKLFEGPNRTHSSYSLSTKTADGGILMGGYKRTINPYYYNGILTKFDSLGHHIWSREILGNVYAPIDFSCLKELSDGSVIVAGRYYSNNYTVTSQQKDFYVAKLSPSGTVLWIKTFFVSLNLNCAANYLQVKDVAEAENGDLVLTGTHIGCSSPRYLVVFKLNSNGDIQWQYYFDTQFQNCNAAGIFYSNNEVTVVAKTNNVYSGGDDVIHVDFLKLAYTTGALISYKGWRINKPYPDSFTYGFTNTLGAVKLDNGNYCVYGQTFGSYNVTPSAVTPHFSVLEFNTAYDFVKGYSINSSVLGNPNFDRIKIDGKGQGVYSILTPDANLYLHIGSVLDGNVQHNRRKSYAGWDTFDDVFESFADGSYAYVKSIGTKTQTNHYLEYSLLHNSDTSSACLGEKYNFSHTVPVQYVPYNFNWTNIQTNLFSETVNNVINTNPFGYLDQDACSQINLCNKLRIHGKAVSCNLSQDFVFTATLNQSCGATVKWTVPDSVTQTFQVVDDTTIKLRFNRFWQGKVFAEINSGCGLVKDSIFVTVFSSPGQVNLGPDQILCAGTNMVLNARNGYAAYLWQDGSADSICKVTKPGLYYVTTTDACGSIFKDSVVITAAAPIPFDAGPDRTKCNGDTLQLQAPAGFLNYSWSNNYNISSFTAQSVVVNPLVDTAYYIKAQKTPGCFAYDTIRIKVFNSPRIDLGADRNFCFGDSALVNAGNGFQNYVWSSGQTTQQVVLKTPGNYSVVATTAEGCKSYDTMSVVHVYSLPNPQLEQEISICKGESKTLNAGSFATYQWSTGDHSSSITVDTLGSYFVTVTDNHGCTGSDTTSVVAINPLPEGFLPSDTALCSYDKLALRPAQNFNSYLWSTGGSTPTVSVSQPGLYWLQVRDSQGCTGKDSILVSSKDCMNGVYIPSAFSPNGDGKNDVFRPLIFGKVKQYSFTIYNRWGQVVFLTSEVGKGWNGKVAGTPQETSVFVWTCTYQFEGGEMKNEKGTVTIIR